MGPRGFEPLSQRPKRRILTKLDYSPVLRYLARKSYLKVSASRKMFVGKLLEEKGFSFKQ